MGERQMKPWEEYQTTESAAPPWEEYKQVAEKPVDVTDDMSNTELVLAGMGKAFTDVGRGAGQVLGLVDREEIAKSRALDESLMNTTSGKIGNFAGNVAAFAPTAFIPGANTYTGAAVIGSSLGLLQPSTSTGETIANTAAGLGGGLFGQKISNVLGKVLARRGATATTQAPIKAAQAEKLSKFQADGYVVPPADVDAGLPSKVLNAFSGQAKTQQKASTINQPITNKLIAKDLGLEPEQPLSREAIAEVRKNAGQAYEVVRNTGRVKTDDQYKRALIDIGKANDNMSKDFPELADDELKNLLTAAQKDEFDASSAIDAIRKLRDKADSFYAKGEKNLGKESKKIADEMENMLGRHLEQSGAPKEVLSNFKDARKLIAKTYTADKALNSATGNIKANKLASELDKGKPLEGGFKEAAEFAKTYGKSAQEIANTNPYSIADAFVGGVGGLYTGGATTAAVAARPVARSLILNPTYQRSFVRPQQSGNSLSNLLIATQKEAIPLGVASSFALAPQIE
jgi:hypothetical protein